MSTTKYMTRRNFRSAHGDQLLGIHDIDEHGNHVITLPYHASTRTKLHELGHVYHNHKPDDLTLREVFNYEGDAELFAYQHMDKALSFKVLIPALDTLVEYNELRVHDLFNLALDYLTKHNIPLDRSSRSQLWWEIRWLVEGRNN